VLCVIIEIEFLLIASLLRLLHEMEDEYMDVEN